MTATQRDTHRNTGAGPDPGPRRAAALAIMAILAAAAFAALIALGTWQVERRAWKLDLIARVEGRIHAPPSPAPRPSLWPAVSAAADEYRHVSVTGKYLYDRETLVQAATGFGAGFWVLTPLQAEDGTVTMVNRGFVPGNKTTPADRAAHSPAGPLTVTGLLRISEPGGGFLRKNDPGADRWHSRDIAGIAAVRGLDGVAPYFIDADGGTPGSVAAPRGGETAAPPTAWPVGGLTVVSFSNKHMGYALTWYGLALMVLGAVWFVTRYEIRQRRSR